MEIKKIKKKLGFSLVEIIIAIAILAVLSAVLAPALLNHVEDSRAKRDEAAMQEVVNALKIASAEESVYEEIMRYSLYGNVSCYIDHQNEADVLANKTIQNPKNETKNKLDQYLYADSERVYDETEYYAAGNMRGMTITFRPVNGKYVMADGVINQFVRGSETPISTMMAEGRVPDAVAYRKEAPKYSEGQTLSTITRKGDTDHHTFDKLTETVGLEIPIISRTYKNSEFTVFLSMNERVDIYGQFNGTNLNSKDYEPLPDVPSPDTGNGGEVPDPELPEPEIPDIGGGEGVPGDPAVPDQNAGNPGDPIPEGAVYYVKVSVSALNPDGYIEGETCEKVLKTININDPSTFPEPQYGDAFVYGDYEYRYGQEWYVLHSEVHNWQQASIPTEWGVRVIDDTKTDYGPMMSDIGLRPVTNLYGTYYFCKNLKNVSQLSSKAEYMIKTFEDCSTMKKAPTIPSGVVSMQETFQDCHALYETPNVPSSVKNMNQTFRHCHSLPKAPYLPTGVRTLREAFSYCWSLNTYYGSKDPEGDFSKYVLPQVQHDGVYGLFEECKQMKKSPVLPRSVTTLENTFVKCYRLEEITGSLPTNVTNMKYTFRDCYALKACPELPPIVQTLNHTFTHCFVLKHAPIIPNEVWDLRGTFYDCYSLTGDVIINSNEVTRAEDALNVCAGTDEDLGLDPEFRHYHCANDQTHILTLKGKASKKIIDYIKSTAATNTCNMTINTDYTDSSADNAGEIFTEIPIPEGGKYYKGAKDGTYEHMTPYTSGNFPIPKTGDVFVYDGYEYRLNYAYHRHSGWTVKDGGWGVIALDKTLTQYPDPLAFIADIPLYAMDYAYFDCVNMTVAPKIPESVERLKSTFRHTDITVAPKLPENLITMQDCFQNCSKLTSVPFPIPASVINVENAFWYCSNLEGEITILCQQGDSYSGAFRNVGNNGHTLILKGTPENKTFRDHLKETSQTTGIIVE